MRTAGPRILASTGKRFRCYFALIPPVPNASAVVFRKSLFERFGRADQSPRLYGGWKLWASMSLRGNVAYSCERLSYFRYHVNNARCRTAQGGSGAVERWSGGLLMASRCPISSSR